MQWALKLLRYERCATTSLLISLNVPIEFLWIGLCGVVMELCPYVPVSGSALTLRNSSFVSLGGSLVYFLFRCRLFRSMPFGVGISFQLASLVVGLTAAMFISAIALFEFEDFSGWKDLACHQQQTCHGLGDCMPAEDSRNNVVMCNRSNSSVLTWCGALFWNEMKDGGSQTFSGFSSSEKCLAFWNAEKTAEEGMAIVVTCGALSIACRGAVIGIAVEDAVESADEKVMESRRDEKRKKRALRNRSRHNNELHNRLEERCNDQHIDVIFEEDGEKDTVELLDLDLDAVMDDPELATGLFGEPAWRPSNEHW
mmetsp:Transcript_43289/g.80151  ORF Transcript_43289/g.80151 Transcript_43289/m.80151 type:complete len:312 (+) Transcript_43289:64-999(+)